MKVRKECISRKADCTNLLPLRYVVSFSYHDTARLHVDENAELAVAKAA